MRKAAFAGYGLLCNCGKQKVRHRDFPVPFRCEEMPGTVAVPGLYSELSEGYCPFCREAYFLGETPTDLVKILMKLL